VPGDGPATVEAAGRTVQISHPEKVFFPGIGATKLDLVNYYAAVSDAFLAAAGRRPALMQRFPEGALGKSFFQKRVPANAPEWLETVEVATVNGTVSNALVLADLAHVLWAVNLACIGFHLWPSRVPADGGDGSEAPFADELRIDLDPQPGVTFEQIREAARLVRDVLDELGLQALPKTTGNRGLHVYVRLEERWTSVEVREAAVALARELERREPTLVTAAWWKEERGKRVFVDFNQNAPHKTVFGAWSVRPRTGGQVSTPLRWEEVDDVVPDDLTLRSVPARLAEHGDPWAASAERPQRLDPLLALAERDRAAGLPDAPWPPQYPKQPGELPRVAPSRARRD
jgi:DNA ligase D-like protein (predicted polymerase)